MPYQAASYRVLQQFIVQAHVCGKIYGTGIVCLYFFKIFQAVYRKTSFFGPLF